MKKGSRTTLAFVLAGLVTGVLFSLGPWKEFQQKRAESDQAVAESQQIAKERSDLIQQSAQLQTPLGREQEARRRGYKKPGERVVELDP